MSTNSKRRTRILQLAVALVVLAGLGFGAYGLRQRQLDREALAARDDGRKALAAGDYRAALDGLGRYLQRPVGGALTAEDYVLYARARRHVGMPNGKHLFAAIASLRTALQRDSVNAEARADLLELYLMTGYATEALALIDTMLESAPGDLHLLRTKCDVLEAQRQFAKALEVAHRINEIAPDDIDSYFRTLRLLVNSQAPPSEVAKWVDKVVSAHGADTRYELLRAAMFLQGSENEKANAILDRILGNSKDLKDPHFVAILVTELDAAGRPDDSMRILEQSGDVDDPQLRRELIRRLWYAGRFPDIVARAPAPGADPAVADPEATALRVVALNAAGHAAEADPLRKGLAARSEPEAKAWSAFVDYTAAPTTDSPSDVAKAFTDAVSAVPDSAILRQALGDSIAALGELDLAMQHWTEAANRAPSWARPLISMAQALMRMPGREFLAPAMAQAALKRAPTNVEAIRTWVEALVSAPGDMEPGQRDRLLRVVRALEKDVPEQSNECLAMEADLLARSGDKAAVDERLRGVLTARTPASEDTLMRLAQVSQRVGIPLETEFFDLSEAIHGITPRLALARAVVRARSDGVAAGLGAFDEARARARSGTSAQDWDLVRASYLDAMNSPDAGSVWVSLADAHPDSLAVQLGALASVGAWQNRDAVARIIERVRGLVHDEGVTWRLARARFLIGAPGAAGAQIAEAATILGDATKIAPSSSIAHVLLAQAFEKLGNAAGAEEQLRLAAELAPDDAWIALEIARLAQQRGHPDVARRQLDRALTLRDLAPEQVERAAYLLAVQGDRRRGMDLLEPLMARPEARRDGAILLIRFYMQMGEFERAVALCEKLLAKPDIEVLELAADLYASAGRTADADATLARLDAVEAAPGDRELVRARHAGKWASPDVAKSWYVKAVAAAPDRADVWTGYVSFAIVAGDPVVLNSILDDQRAAIVEPIRFLSGMRELCNAAMKDDRLRVLLLASLTDKPNWPVLTEAIRVTAEGWGDVPKRPAVARSLRGLADSNPTVLPVQILAATLGADTGELRTACGIAMRSMHEFPNSAPAARQAAELLARSGRWTEALDAALAWRARVSRRDVLSELFVARAFLRTGRPADAVATLEPDAPAALQRPDENAQFVLTYAIALLATGQNDRATQTITSVCRTSSPMIDAFLQVESEWFADAAAATRWLGACAAVVAPDDIPRRVSLGRAWGRAWERFHDPVLLSTARKELAAVLAKPGAPIEAYVASATLAQGAGELEAARSGYVAALEHEPANIEARNNLAMVLADLGKWQQAVDEATKVTAAAPKLADGFDTLAYALRKGREFAKAKAALSEACRLEPTNPSWQLSLAETLAENGETAECDRVIARIDEMAANGPPLAGAVRDRLEHLRSRPR